MTEFKAGDKVRYKAVSRSPYDSWEGLEGVVVAGGCYDGAVVVKVTKASDDGQHGNVGRESSLTTANLELVKDELHVGDKIRANNNVLSTDWIGLEGIITAVKYIGESARIKITANPAYGYNVGDHITLPPRKFDVIGTELPRTVERDEIRVGDKIRVTYPDRDTMVGDVRRFVTVFREGVVADIREKGGDFESESGCLIDSYLEGRSEAVYTLLERPEPVKAVEVRQCATEPVGTQFKADDQARTTGQGRVFTKIAENQWTDIFMYTGNVYTATDAEAQVAFDNRKGDWIKL